MALYLQTSRLNTTSRWGNIMMTEKRNSLNKNLNYDFIIHSSYFFPFNEASLRLSFFIDDSAETMVGYYHLAINEFEKNADADKTSSMNFNNTKSKSTRKLFKQVALA